SLNDVVVDHMHQPWRTFAALINKSLSRKTTILDKLCLSRAQILWGATPPKKAQKFKKSASPKLTTVSALTKTPTRKSKGVNKHAKKSTESPARGVVIRETFEMPLTKKKEKVDVTLDETKINDKAKGDKDEEIDYTTSQLYDDVDIRLNERDDTDEEFVQEEGTDATMTNIQKWNKNPKILQVIEYAHVTLSTVPQKTEVSITSASHSSNLATKFLKFSDIPHTDAEIVSPLDVHVHHE
nr:hypothetical protein [Tanacetum cinerariifolium]